MLKPLALMLALAFSAGAHAQAAAAFARRDRHAQPVEHDLPERKTATKPVVGVVLWQSLAVLFGWRAPIYAWNARLNGS